MATWKVGVPEVAEQTSLHILVFGTLNKEAGLRPDRLTAAALVGHPPVEKIVKGGRP